MTIPTFSIGGLASGLDTNSIISQLLQLERAPVTQAEQRRATYQSRNDAWSQISTRLSALKTKLAAVDETSDWTKFATATSSDDTKVGITANGSTAPTSVSFTVDRLAAAHQMVDGGSFTKSSDLVGAGTFTLTVGGVAHSVTTDATTTLSELASHINDLGAGISASLLTVDTDQVKLVLASKTSGDASVFTVDSAPAAMGSFSITQQGQDARITLGSGGGALTVERSTNTVSDLIAGTTITLKGTTTAPVTLGVDRDIDKAVTAVKAVVDEFNTTMAKLDALTKTATEGSTTSGPLSSDSTARTLKLQLRSAISGAIAGLSGSYTTASSAGISLTRSGTLTLDETKLRDALETDYDAVTSVFARTSAVTDPRVSVTRAPSSDLDGTHAISITQAATTGSVTGSAYLPPVTDEVFTITVGSSVADVTITAGSDQTTAMAAITSALSSAGITTIDVADSGGAISLTDQRYGSAAGFTVSSNGLGLAGTFNGTDVAGTIGGIAATGEGRNLTGTGDLDGLILTITASQASVDGAGGTLSLGSVSITSGRAATFSELIDSYTDADGTISRATERWDSMIKLTNDRIAELEERLSRREAYLRSYYAGLETNLNRLQSTMGSILSSLNSLNQ